MSDKPTSEMLEPKVGGIKGLFKPVAYTIKARQINDNLWHLVYSERFAIKNSIMRQEAITNSTRMVKQIYGETAKISVKGQTITVDMNAPFENIASMIGGEFFFISKLADLSLRDVFLAAGFAILKQKKKK